MQQTHDRPPHAGHDSASSRGPGAAFISCGAITRWEGIINDPIGAVLAYLVLARPRGFHRRDKLLPLFWPGRGQKSARNALSNMLYHTRQELGEDAIVNRGAEEIGVRRAHVSCDVIAFEEALEQENEEQALPLYRGDLLKGFYVPDAAPEFEHWLDGERERLRLRAAEGAWRLADKAERRDDCSEARSWAHKAAGFAPFSDESQRRLITLLQRTGDRAGALDAYESFATRLRAEWAMEPTDELKALVERMGSEESSEATPPQAARVPSTSDQQDTVPAEAVQDHSPDPSASHVSDAEETTPSHMVSRSRWPLRRWGAVGGAALLVMLGVALSWAFEFGGLTQNSVPAVSNERSVAVLPFTYIGAKDSTDYFSLGMTEEILTRLAQVSDLSVISRTSVMQYRDTEKPLRTIGEELGARTVVEGSVQQAGDQVRITAQLIDARTDRHLWSDSYDRRLEDILAVQSEVAQRIAGALQANLLPQEQAQLMARRQVDETAYHLYLRAQHLRDRRDSIGIFGSSTLFQQSIRHDSSFAPAHGGVALSFFWSGLFRWIPRETAEEKVLEAADRALALDSTVVEAHLAKALVYQIFRRDWDRSERALRQALRFNPNHSEARSEYGWQLLRLGRVESALVQMRRAAALNPRSWHAHHNLGYTLYCNRQYEDAVQVLETARELGSQLWYTKAYLLHALLKQSQRLLRQGWSEEVEAPLEHIREMYPDKDPQRLNDLENAVKGRQEHILQRLDQVERPAREKLTLLLLVEEAEQALDLIDQLMSFDSEVYADPLFDPVRDHPRFEQFVEKRLGRDMDLH